MASDDAPLLNNGVVKPTYGDTPAVVSHATNGHTRSSSGSGPSDASPAVRIKPTQMQQILLFVITLNESFNENVIWPFLPFMVKGFGYSEEDVGVYVGILGSSFYAAQLTSSLAWGRLSDMLGRRPTILAGTLGTVFAIAWFGMAPSYAQAVCARCLSGILNGNIGITKTYLAEITDSHSRAAAFGILLSSWGVGSILAPAIGGFLSDPVKNLGGAFADVPLFVNYPYVFPCMFNGVMGLSAFILGYFYLPETKPFLERRAKTKARAAAKAAGEVENPFEDDGSEKEESSIPIRVLFRSRPIWSSIGTYFCLALFWVLFDETFPVFCQTPVDEGGLGQSESQIGIQLAICGAALIIFQTTCYGPMAKRWGIVKLYTWAAWIQIPVFVLWPLSNYVAAANLGAGVEWTLLAIYQIARSILSAITFTAICIAIANAGAPQHTGTINGASQSLAALARALGPITGGALWSWSVSIGGAGSNFILHGIIGIIGVISCVTFVHRLDPVLDLPWLERQALLEQAIIDDAGKASHSDHHATLESIDLDAQHTSGQYSKVHA